MAKLAKLVEDVYLQPGSNRMAFNMSLDFGADHSLIEADNGTGKSSILESFMSIFDPKYIKSVNGRERYTTVEAAAQVGWRNILVTTADFLLDSDYRRTNGDDMILGGTVGVWSEIDGSNPMESVLRFIYPDSSDIYTDPEKYGKTPAQSLGIEFARGMATDGECYQISSYEDIRTLFRARKDRALQQGVEIGMYDIKRKRAAFLDSLCDDYGIDMRRYLSTVGKIIRQEGLNELTGYLDDGFLELFIYGPAEELYLSKDNSDGVDIAESITDKLTKYALTDVQDADKRKQQKFLERKAESFASFSSSVDRCEKAEVRLGETEAELSKMYGRVQHDIEQNKKRLGSINDRIALKENDLKEARALKASKKIVAARGQRDEAGERLESALSAQSFQKQKRDLAEFTVLKDSWLDAVSECKKIEHQINGIDSALRELRSGDRGQALNDTSWTLWTLHEKRKGAAEKDLRDAQSSFNEAQNALDGAEKSYSTAVKNLTLQEGKVTAARRNVTSSYGQAELKLRELGLTSLADDESHSISSAIFGREMEKAVEAEESAVAAAASAKEILKDADREKDAARTSLDECRGEKANAASECERAGSDSRNIAKKAEAVKLAVGDANIDSIDRAADRKEIELDEVGELDEQVLKLRAEKKDLEGRLAAVESGKFLIPQGFEGHLRKTGIAYQTGETFLKTMASNEGGIEKAKRSLKVHPWLPAAIIVPDGLVPEMASSLRGQKIEPFAGSIPIVSLSYAMGEQTTEFESLCFDDLDYFVDQAGYMRAIQEKVKVLAEEIEELRSKKAIAEGRIRTLVEFVLCLQAKGYTTVAEAAAALEKAASMLEECKAAEIEAQDNLDKAVGEVEARKSQAEEASQAEQAARQRVKEFLGCKLLIEQLDQEHVKLNEQISLLKRREEQELATREQLDETRRDKNGAESRMKDAAIKFNSVNSELDGVSKVEDGKIIEGKFDELRASYMQLSAAAEVDETQLLASRNDAKKELGQRDITRKGAYENARDALKDYCEQLADVDFEQRLSEEMVEDGHVGANEREEHKKELKAASRSYMHAAEQANKVELEANAYRATVEELEADFKVNFDGHRIVEDEDALSQDFNAVILGLNRALESAGNRCREINRRLTLLDDLKNLFADEGIVACEADDLDEIANLSDFRKVAEEEKRERRTAHASLAKERSALVSRGGRAFSIASDEKWNDLAAFTVELESFAKQVEEYAGGAESIRDINLKLGNLSAVCAALMGQIKTEIDFKDPAFESAAAVLMKVVEKSLGYITALEKDTEGMIRVYKGGRCRPNDPGYSGDFMEKIKSVLRGITDGAFSKTADNDMRMAYIRKDVKEYIVNVKALLAFHIAITDKRPGGTSRRLSIKFRSTREGQRGEFLTWKKVKGQSGGEGAEVYLQILIMIAKSCFGESKDKSAFVIVDNPFANLKNADRFRTCMDLANRTGVQLIVTSQLNPPIVEQAYFPYHALLYSRRYENGAIIKNRQLDCDAENSFIVDYRAKNFGDHYQRTLF